jgi:hypothetical protein
MAGSRKKDEPTDAKDEGDKKSHLGCQFIFDSIKK